METLCAKNLSVDRIQELGGVANLSNSLPSKASLFLEKVRISKLRRTRNPQRSPPTDREVGVTLYFVHFLFRVFPNSEIAVKREKKWSKEMKFRPQLGLMGSH